MIKIFGIDAIAVAWLLVGFTIMLVIVTPYVIMVGVPIAVLAWWNEEPIFDTVWRGLF